MATEPASYKDPGGRVYLQENQVFRVLTPRGTQIWKDIESSGLYTDLALTEKLLIETTALQNNPLANEGSLVLEHKKIPFISYAYEWPPSLLKKCALLHLNLIEQLLKKRFILKDATPFNVQFNGLSPIFIDILSIEKLIDGDPWIGYGQFLDTMLYPLMLYYHKGVGYHDWLKGSSQGLPAKDISNFFPLKDIFKAGVFIHVWLRSLLNKKFQDPRKFQRSDIQKAKFPITSILKNVIGIKSVIESLKTNQTTANHWTTYATQNSYHNEALDIKKKFVLEALKSLKPQVVWDFGSNTGDFSLMAAKEAERVIAFDNDVETVEILVERLENEKVSNVLPLVMDLTNPSPSLGWNCKERSSIFSREKPDLILALALIHHLAVVGHVPLEEQLMLFHQLSPNIIIEYVDREDPMFLQLKTNTGIEFDDYNENNFIRSVSKYYVVLNQSTLSSTRKIYFLERKELTV